MRLKILLIAIIGSFVYASEKEEQKEESLIDALAECFDGSRNASNDFKNSQSLASFEIISILDDKKEKTQNNLSDKESKDSIQNQYDFCKN